MSTKLSAQSEITAVPLIGPKYAEKLARLDITTVEDLLTHFPFRYSDTRDMISLEKLVQKKEGTVLVTIDSVSNTRTRSGKWLTKANISDHSGSIEAVWFNQPYLKKSLKTDEQYLMNGKLNTKWGKPSLINPQYELAKQDESTHLGKLTPVYPETKGVSSKWIRSRIKTLKSSIDRIIEDPLNKKIIEDENLLEYSEAVEKIHFPEVWEDVKQARERIGLNELIAIQIKLQKYLAKKKKYRGIEIEINRDTSQKLLESLPFELTGAQKTALKEILEDISEVVPMYRLLNGDVGSGKTIVALTAALEVYDSGYTTVIMAPTTILATQHYKNIKEKLKKAEIETPISLVTSKQKDDIDPATPQIIVGTHALFYDQEIPENTALVIVDEQHRFGVAQREKLVEIAKSDSKTRPHYLNMTATPIPRTLTMALYGQQNVSVLDQLPPGRLPVKTYLVPEKKRSDSYNWIKEKLNQEIQAIVICPLVEESDKVEAKSVKQEFKRLKNKVFTEFELELMHGQLTEDEKNEILEGFRDKEFDILVATPVVEVGIDIPNANIMIIENAERFGLAQLHQFRGRVGRSSTQAHCFLFTESTSENALERLQFFSKNNSGFDVAEFDLENRGPGEVYGVKQSGILNLQFADITNTKKIKQAQRIAKRMIEG